MWPWHSSFQAPNDADAADILEVLAFTKAFTPRDIGLETDLRGVTAEGRGGRWWLWYVEVMEGQMPREK